MKELSMYIYKITNKTNGKSYIGQTNDFSRRMREHCSRDYMLIDRKIQQYGKENFDFSIILQDVSEEDIDILEIYYIEKYNTLVPNGYNIKLDVKQTKGEDNPNSILTQDEAQWIVDNRDVPSRKLYQICPFRDRITFNTFNNIYHQYSWKHLIPKSVMCDNSNILKGESCFRARYTNEEVYQIREDYKNGVYYKDAWTRSGKKVTLQSFYNLYIGHGYEDVHMDVYTEENKKKHKPDHSGENNGRAKLTKQDVLKIRELHAQNVSNQTIYELFPQVTPASIRAVINHVTWKNI